MYDNVTNLVATVRSDNSSPAIAWMIEQYISRLLSAALMAAVSNKNIKSSSVPLLQHHDVSQKIFRR